MTLLSEDKQSFVDDILDKFKLLVLGNMSDALVSHHADQQIEWDWTIAMLFTHLNSLHRWTESRNVKQFDSFARHSMPTADAPANFVCQQLKHSPD